MEIPVNKLYKLVLLTEHVMVSLYEGNDEDFS